MPGESAINVLFVGRNGHWVCYAQTRDDHQQFVFYSVCPMAMPEFKRTSVAEYLTRANYGLIIGNFELDYRDGEVRFKTSLDVEGDERTSALARQCVRQCVEDGSVSARLVSVVNMDIAPADAVAPMES